MTVTPQTKVLLLGGSKNVGYFAGLRFLRYGAQVTYVLRNVNVFDADEAMRPFIQNSQARLIQGDATSESDLKAAWEIARRGGDNYGVDVVLCTVGPVEGKHSLTKKWAIEPRNVCAISTRTLLATLPKDMSPIPRIILVSTAGLTKESRSTIPVPHRALYAYTLKHFHDDKRGAERVLAHCLGHEWNEKEQGKVEKGILPPSWAVGLPTFGSLKGRITSVKAPVLSNGECLADIDQKGANAYRVQEKKLEDAWVISRKDMAHFIVEELVMNDRQFGDHDITIAY